MLPKITGTPRATASLRTRSRTSSNAPRTNRAPKAAKPASSVVETILMPRSACLCSAMSSVSLREDVGRTSSPRIRNSSRFAPNARSLGSNVALSRDSLPFGTNWSVPIEDGSWVLLLRMPELFQVGASWEEGGDVSITSCKCAINRQQEKAGAAKQFLHQSWFSIRESERFDRCVSKQRTSSEETRSSGSFSDDASRPSCLHKILIF